MKMIVDKLMEGLKDAIIDVQLLPDFKKEAIRDKTEN